MGERGRESDKLTDRQTDELIESRWTQRQGDGVKGPAFERNRGKQREGKYEETTQIYGRLGE